jgi:hypothetical protein
VAIWQLSEQLMPLVARANRMVVRKPEGDQGDPAGTGPAIAIGRADKVTVTRRAERACPAEWARFRGHGKGQNRGPREEGSEVDMAVENNPQEGASLHVTLPVDLEGAR